MASTLAQDKGADQQPDLASVLQGQDEGDKIDQHPHGARVEAVNQAQDDGQDRQGVLPGVD
ncbi:MAG: hypothetical protein COZ12_07995 [Deltaproteobacteria bacterium CG_4_10_14_3_um_filter_60_8]|nr:MAG: hypothetical protein AUK28_04770 [Desulfobacterales bacterium CG2_30_60_27]PIP43604.1 MAG: hypothetical protein COX17_06065 [Deltaproteobacteria bacterium CG23_combo_of_CG06-09_8_20_14_all_60_8]PIY20825.1 MAG: hypothetical protein COZ12_07995 [Deltaproteobacteria bacterium CG_4_10_14_3_um_filter_60_8]